MSSSVTTTGRRYAGGASSLRLVRARSAPAVAPALDARQAEVVDAPRGSGSLVVLGAPGTGKTTTVVEAFARRVERDGTSPDAVLLLAPSRLAASGLRDRVSARLGRTSVEPAARSVHAYAFSLLRRTALAAGQGPPRLVSGAEQDRVLADLLAGHARGEGTAPGWPDELEPALGPHGAGLRGLRDELRELLMRCLERGLGPEDLAGLGRRVGRLEWEAAARVLAEYEEVGSLRDGGMHDPSGLVDAAVRELEDDADLLADERARWQLVVVEDHHESGAAVARLLEVLTPVGSGADLLVTGDPDSTTQSFRGGDPALVADLARRADRTVVLGVRHRAGGRVAVAARRVADAIPSAGTVAQRRAEPEPRAGDVPAAAGRSGAGTEPAAPAVAGRSAAPQLELDLGLGGGAPVVDAAVAGSDGPAPVRHPAAGAGSAPGTAAGDGASAAAASTVERAVLGSVAAEGAYVAHVLRDAHLLRDVPWSQMAVLVRSTGRTGPLRRALVGAGVPVSEEGVQLPVRDEPAVRPLLLALAVALEQHRRGGLPGDPVRPSDVPSPDGVGPVDGAHAGRVGPAAGPRVLDLDAQTAVELLTSPLGGADAVLVRRLRRRLRAAERAAGGGRGSDELLVELLLEEAGPGAALVLERESADVEPAARVLQVLRAGRAALAVAQPGVEDVLWSLWSASGLAARWQAQALSGGPAAQRADRDLDAVVALFEAASRFADSTVARTPRQLLEHLAAQDVPADTLAERAPATGSVALLTPQTAAGREWDLVVVAGLQDGVWPDTRVRGGLLGAQALVDLLAGRDDTASGTGPGARVQVLADEQRLLHVAVTRARRRLVVTAVRDGETRPSPFLDLVAPPVPAAAPAEGSDQGSVQGPDDGEDALTPVPRQVTLPALVAELRQVLLTPVGCRDGAGREVDDRRRQDAALELARLADADVPGADPDDWYGLAPLSDDGPLHPGPGPVPVSPSKVEQFAACPLRWVLEASGATTGESTGASVGTLVHDLAATMPDADHDALAAALDERWPELGIPSTWAGGRQRMVAEGAVRNLAGYLAAADGRELVGTEVDVRVEVGRALLTGRVDRLERDAQGRLVVVDLKTGTPVTKDEVVEHPQLGAYQAAVEAGAFSGDPGEDEPSPAVSGGAALVNVSGKRGSFKEQKQTPLASTPDPDWARALVERTAEGMAGADFLARDGDACRTCPVRTSCPLRVEGRQVGS